MRKLAPALASTLVVAALSAPAAAEGPPSPYGSVFAPRPTAAPTPAPAPAPLPPGDERLGLKQFGLAALGTVATVGLGLGLTLSTNDQESNYFGLSVVAAPTVAGMVVCGVGRWSLLYEGRCGAAVAGAYIGALGGMVPALLILVGCSDAADSCLPVVVVTAIAGYVVGTSAGALVGWNISRRPRSVPVADVPGGAQDDGDDGEHLAQAERAAPLPAGRGGASLPRQLVFPIFAASF